MYRRPARRQKDLDSAPTARYGTRVPVAATFAAGRLPVLRQLRRIRILRRGNRRPASLLGWPPGWSPGTRNRVMPFRRNRRGLLGGLLLLLAAGAAAAQPAPPRVPAGPPPWL